MRLDDIGDALQFVVSALLDAGEVASTGKLSRLVSQSLSREIAAAYHDLPAIIEARRLVWVTDSDLQQNVVLRGQTFQAVKSPACAAGPVIGTKFPSPHLKTKCGFDSKFKFKI